MRATAATFLLLSIAIHADLRAQSTEEIRLDGLFDDWSHPDSVVTDPKGDADGAFDLSRVSVVVHGATLYVRFDTQESLNLQSGSTDDGTLRLRLDLAAKQRLEVDLRKRQALLITQDSTSTIPWQQIRFASLPTYAARDFELRLDLGPLGVRAGDTVALDFKGSDTLSEPVRFTIEQGTPQTVKPRDVSKRAGSIRVASLNTLKDGSASPERAPSIKNLFEFADADIYCFNESLDEKKFRATCFDVLPEALANVRNVHWSAACGIVSRYPLAPLAFKCREAAALIRPPGATFFNRRLHPAGLELGSWRLTLCDEFSARYGGIADRDTKPLPGQNP